jgi:molybdate transport system regulatory protein
MTHVELQIRVKKDNKLLLTPEGAHLLKLIARSGSLLTASKEIGISYNKAWKMLEFINQAVNDPIVEKQRGGKGGGGAVLTSYGKLIINEYEVLENQVRLFSEKLNVEINL